MNVARPLVEGFHEELVHQPNDRRRLGRFGEFSQFGRDFVEEFDPFFQLLCDKLGDRIAANAQAILDELHDLVLAGQDGIKANVGERAELIERFEIEGIAGRDSDMSVDAFERQHSVTEHRGRGKHRQRSRVDLEVLQRDEPHVQFLREGFQNGFLADDSLRNENLIDPLAGAFQAGGGDLVLRREAAVEEK